MSQGVYEWAIIRIARCYHIHHRSVPLTEVYSSISGEQDLTIECSAGASLQFG